MRFSFRLALVFALFGLAILTGLLTYHVRVVRRESYDRGQEMGANTLAAVRALVAAQARAGRFGKLGSNLSDMMRQAGIATVEVRDRRGRVLLRRVDVPRLLGRQPHPGVPIDKVADGVYDVQSEVPLSRGSAGSVLVGYHTAELQARLDLLESRVVQWGVTAFLGVILIAWLMGAWLGLRIERLVPRLEALPRDPERFRPLEAKGRETRSGAWSPRSTGWAPCSRMRPGAAGSWSWRRASCPPCSCTI